MNPSVTAHKAIWNFSIVGLNKVAQTIGSVAFVLIIPRMLGADQFGQFAFITSLFIISTKAGDLGLEDVLVRFIPEQVAGDETESIRYLVGRLLAFRLVIGAATGVLAGIWALNVTDWMSPAQAVFVGLTIWLYIIALLPYEVLLGLGRVGRWSINTSWRQFALIAAIGLLYGVWKLGFDGVVLALLASQLFFVALGLWWMRAYLSRRYLRLDWGAVRPYLMAGLVFFAANVLLALVHRGGALAIEVLIHDPAQIGFFELGNSLYLMLFLAISQAMMALLPLASRLHVTGGEAEVGRWFALLQRFGVVLAMVIVGGVWGMAPLLVPPVFGEAYRPVIDTLRIGMPALALMMLGYPAGMLAVVWRKPHIRLWAGVWALAATAVTMSTIVIWGANGAALAVVAGVAAYTAAIWYVIREQVQLAWDKGLLGLGLGVVFLPLFWVGGGASISSAFMTTALTIGLALIFLILAFAFKIITVRELQIIIQALRHKN